MHSIEAGFCRDLGYIKWELLQGNSLGRNFVPSRTDTNLDSEATGDPPFALKAVNPLSEQQMQA